MKVFFELDIDCLKRFDLGSLQGLIDTAFECGAVRRGTHLLFPTFAQANSFVTRANPFAYRNAIMSAKLINSSVSIKKIRRAA